MTGITEPRLFSKLLEAVSQWAERHFGQARLRHKSRTRRLVEVAVALALKPGASLRQALPTRAEYDGALRLFRTSMATHHNVIASHCDLVHQEALRPGHYFFIQDKTELDYTGRKVRGLGPIGDHKGQGIHAQTTLCVEIDDSQSPGLPPRPRRLVGIAHQSLWTRDPHKPTKSQSGENWRERLERSRESEHWGEAFAEMSASLPPGVKWTYVADRESDLTPILDRSRLPKNGDFIIRLFRQRLLSEESSPEHRLLHEAVEGAPELGGTWVDVRARKGQRARRAKLVVRSVEIEFKAAPGKPLWAVELREVDAPADVEEPIYWLLGTSWPARTLEEAVVVARAYALRWLVEEYHKAWKSGVRVEKAQLKEGFALESLAGVLAVLAVRLLGMKLELEPSASADEQEVVTTILEEKVGLPKEGEWTQREILRGIAKLGGFMGRKRDGEPGWQTIWRGMRELIPLVEGYNLARQRLMGGRDKPPDHSSAPPSTGRNPPKG